MVREDEDGEGAGGGGEARSEADLCRAPPVSSLPGEPAVPPLAAAGGQLPAHPPPHPGEDRPHRLVGVELLLAGELGHVHPGDVGAPGGHLPGGLHGLLMQVLRAVVEQEHLPGVHLHPEPPGAAARLPAPPHLAPRHPGAPHPAPEETPQLLPLPGHLPGGEVPPPGHLPPGDLAGPPPHPPSCTYHFLLHH